MRLNTQCELWMARQRINQAISTNVMLAKIAIHLEAEKVRDDINYSVQVAEVETELHRFRHGFKAMKQTWEARK